MEGKRVLVTGGAGFLGSHFVRHALAKGARTVVNADLLTYAGDQRRLMGVSSDSRYRFAKADVASADDVEGLFRDQRPQVVVHFAAESHVTRSESAPDLFFRTNIEGTRVLLEAAHQSEVERFVYISTDEVYGPILSGAYREDEKPPGEGKATSPYARSKALADDLAQSWADRVPVIVARGANAFGPFQFPEKMFARSVTRALRGEPVLVWGDGLYVRPWLSAEDFTRGIALLVRQGDSGQVYNVAPHHEPDITNLELAKWLLGYLELPEDLLQLTAYDRPDHDRRYALDASKLRRLGWEPGDVWEQFAQTVDWYRSNPGWWEPLIETAEAIYTDAR